MDVPYFELIAVIVCVALSILFSGSETALNALSSTRLDRLLETFSKNGVRHRFLSMWRKNRNEALTVILVGNNVVNIAASAMATVAFEQIFQGTGYAGFAIPTAIFVTTFLVLTFGEIIPKTFAQNNPERFVAVTRILYPFAVMIKPIVWFFTKLSAWFITKSGGRLDPLTETVTEEVIEDNIAQAAEQGHLDQEQERLLSSVLELDDTLTKEVMIPRTKVVGVAKGTSLSDLLTAIKEAGHSRYPVYEDDIDQIIGVLHVRDLLGQIGRDKNEIFNLEEILREPYFVPSNKNIQDLLSDLKANRTHLAVVVDEHGGTAGIVTIEDIIEEVFGEIYDEYDEGDEGEDLVIEVGADTWEADAGISIRDLEDVISVEFPDDDSYSTIAGFILKKAGGIPDVGQSITWELLTITVLEADEKHIIRIQITRNHEKQNEEEIAVLKQTGS
ncbi:MAG TPA: HlyC/CorC family transporter [Myxococcales bacterium]|nr:HlyC/CorC family transporter [Myxococcales bacterium]